MTYSQYPAPGVPAYNAGPPLWAPYYGAPFKVAVQRFWKKYAIFSGRASRSEFWWWTLVSSIVTGVINILSGVGAAAPTDFTTGADGDSGVFGLVLAFVWTAATIVPTIALTVRRLHDQNLSGWLALMVLVPFVGVLALLVMMALPSNPAGQRFDRPEGVPVSF